MTKECAIRIETGNWADDVFCPLNRFRTLENF